MEKKKRTIITIASVIALAMAILGCGVLLGCGNTEVDIPPQTNDRDSGIIDPSGIFIKTEDGEIDTYDIDDVTVRLLCGIDIDMFNKTASEAYDWQTDDKAYEYGVFMYAYNTENYSLGNINGWHIPNHDKIYTKLRNMDEGTIQDGVFLLKQMPYTLTNEYSDGNITKIGEADNLISLDCLRDTEYDGLTSGSNYFAVMQDEGDKYEIACFNKQTVALPRELFIGDNGEVEIRITAFIYSHFDGSVKSVSSNAGSYDGSTVYRYNVKGGIVKLTKPYTSGGCFIKDGTDVKEIKTKYIFDGLKNHTA